MTNTKLTGTIGGTSAPLGPSAVTPGHTAAENLDPALVSFPSMGQQNGNGAAQLCGNVTASSLAMRSSSVCRALSIPSLSALNASGRFKVSVMTP